jgi:hypothetical protein
VDDYGDNAIYVVNTFNAAFAEINFVQDMFNVIGDSAILSVSVEGECHDSM